MLQKVLGNISDQGAYNEQILQDADSTTFLVGFHQALNGSVPAQLIENWLKFQNEEGSWATYRHEAELRKTLDLDSEISVEGWLSGHACVSAAAALVVSDFPQLSVCFDKTIQYLAALIENNQLNAYWWTSNIYSQAFALLALSKSENYAEHKIKLTTSIVGQQLAGGFWVNHADNTPNAFYTALALKALLAHQPENQQTAIAAAANWLQNHQTTDGSWQTSRILRIPATDVANPATVKVWRNSSFGVNALSDDYNRVFTTATVVNVLYDYQNRSKK